MKSRLKAIFPFFLLFQFNLIAQQFQLQWGKQSLGLGSMYTKAADQCVDGQGNIYVVGGFNGTVDFDPSSSSTVLNSTSSWDIFIAKYNSLGELVWAKKIGNVGWDEGVGIEFDNNGSILVLGSFSGTVDFDPSTNVANQTATGTTGLFISKFDLNGNYLWCKTLSGTSNVNAKNLKLDNGGNILIIGNFNGTTDVDPSTNTTLLNTVGGYDLFVTKLDNLGNYIWTKAFGGVGTDYGNAIEINSLNEIFFSGSFQGTVDFDPSSSINNLTSNGVTDGFLGKIDSNGNFNWAFQIGGSTSSDQCNSLCLNDQNQLVVTGKFENSTDFDPSANTFLLNSTGTPDAFIATYSFQGSLISAFVLSGNNNEIIKQISFNNGNYYIYGSFYTTVDFDLQSGVSNYTASSEDVFISKYTSNWNLQWVSHFYSVGNESATSMLIDGANDEVILTGLFNYPLDVDLSSSSLILNPGGSIGTGNEMFLCKYKDCNVNAPLADALQNLCSWSQVLNLNAVGVNINWYDSPTGGNLLDSIDFLVDGNNYYASQTIDGCESIDRVDVVVNFNDPVINANVQHISCNGFNDGQIDVEITEGTPIYQIDWFPPVSTNTTATDLSPNDYTISVLDANGCFSELGVTVFEPNPIITSFVNTASQCSGPCTGELFCDAIGGTIPLSFQWNSLAGNQTEPIAINLCPGTYSVQITDANGCVSNFEGTVEANAIQVDNEIFLTNLAAVDQNSVSPSFASFYVYNLPTSISPPVTNPRNFVDPGKKARFKVESKNQKQNGQSVVSGICKVRSNCAYIEITDSSSALNNIGWNNFAWSADEFEIDIDPNTPQGTNAFIDFIIQENGIEYATTCISIPIHPLVYSPTTMNTIDDDNNPDSQGNNNDICEPGETIEFYPWLDNISTLDAEYVRGRFENLDNHGFINIWDGVAGVGTTVYDATWWNYSFAQPQTINPNSVNTTPEYDFVFDYNSSSTLTDFNLYMVMAGGFNLFNSSALSLVQWSLPFTFNSTGGPVSIDENGELTDQLLIYPNPASNSLSLISKDGVIDLVIVRDLSGKIIIEQMELGNELSINVENLSNGTYLLECNHNKRKTIKKLIIVH